MNVETVKTLARLKGIRQADVAAMAGVSRQAVHRWWSSEQVNIEVLAGSQKQLAESFGVSMGLLSEKLPVVSNRKLKKALQTQLLWDKLYPDIEHFVRALVVGNLDALARLTQVFGFFAAEKIAGSKVWTNFPKYKSKIHPARRRMLEMIWTEMQNQI